MQIKNKNFQPFGRLRARQAAVAFVLIILGLIFFANYAKAPLRPGSGQAERGTSEFGEVNFVYDGDTYRVKTDAGEFKTVRIIGADSPEVQSPYRDEQCFGPEASEFARETFLGKRVELVRDSLTEDKDKYDRYLRYLKLGTGDYISKVLLENGYARVYLPANFKEKENFTKLEKQAQDQNLGIWKYCAGPSFNN